MDAPYQNYCRRAEENVRFKFFFKMILRNIFEHNMELPDIFLENLDVYRRMNTPLPNPLPLFLTHVHQRIHSYSHNTIYALLSK